MMKQFFPTGSKQMISTCLILFIFMKSTAFLYAQHKKDGILYNFTFFIEKQLIDEYYKIFYPKQYTTDFTTGSFYSKEKTDSLVMLTNLLLSEFLNLNLYIPRIESFITPGPGYIENLPGISYKKAQEEGEFDMYIKFGCRIDIESAESSDIGYKAIKLTPKILVSIQINDKDKNILWKNNLTVSEFSDFATKSEIQADPKEKRKALMITPEDIYNLYKYALTKLLETYTP